MTLVSVLVFAIAIGVAPGAPPPPPGGTEITLIAWRLKTIGSWGQVVTWLGNKGYTIASVSGAQADVGRPPGGAWSRTSGARTKAVTIVLNETLDAEEKTTLQGDIIAATSGVSVQ